MRGSGERVDGVNEWPGVSGSVETFGEMMGEKRVSATSGRDFYHPQEIADGQRAPLHIP